MDMGHAHPPRHNQAWLARPCEVRRLRTRLVILTLHFISGAEMHQTEEEPRILR